MRTYYLFTIIVLLNIAACKKPVSPTCAQSPFTVLNNENFEESTKTENYNNDFLILNEGGFNYGNATISAYNESTKSIKNNIFEKQNHYKLGDIVQSINTQDELSYICVNNSQKIEVVNSKTFERKRTITGFSSPRYIAFINETDVIISDLYENSIQVINIETACILGKINTKGWTEEIFKSGDNFWAIERNSIGVADKFANLILLNTTDFSISKRIAIPVEPNSIIQDHEENLWILSSGFEAANKVPQLIKFNTQTESIEKSFSFSDFENTAQNLCFSTTENALYFNRASAIYKMLPTDSELVTNPIFSSAAQLIYGLDIQPSSKELYICDAVDYVSNGKVFRYSNSGNLLDEFSVGVLPSKLIF